MNRLLFCIAGVLVSCVCASGAPVRNAFDPSIPVESFTGAVRVVAVGGLETPARRAVAIGECNFELLGERESVDALFEAEGHEVEVRGVVHAGVAVGGESWPVLTVLSVERICKCLPGASGARLTRLAASRVLEFLASRDVLDLLAPPRVVETRVLENRVLVAVEHHRTSDPIPVRRDVSWFEYRIDGDAVSHIPAPPGGQGSREAHRAAIE